MGLYIEDPKIALFLTLVVILMTMLGEANQKTLFETAMNPYQCSMIGQERLRVTYLDPIYASICAIRRKTVEKNKY